MASEWRPRGLLARHATEFSTASKEQNMTVISVIVGSTRQGRFSEKQLGGFFNS
jgi:hypothetical protein